MVRGVTYNKVKGNPFGRSTPEKSLPLFTIRAEVRHIICKSFYIDVDICKCHPEILFQICTANSIPCPLLEQYVQNKKYYLDMRHCLQEYVLQL